MKNIIKSNRRKTSRFDLNIPGEIILRLDGKISNEQLEISNISYNGIQVVFSNNDFLYDFFECYKDENNEIIVKFQYEEENYEFHARLLWVRLYNLGERNFYVLSGLTYKKKEKIENDIIKIILNIQMKNVYIGKIN